MIGGLFRYLTQNPAALLPWPEFARKPLDIADQLLRLPVFDQGGFTPTELCSTILLFMVATPVGDSGCTVLNRRTSDRFYGN